MSMVPSVVLPGTEVMAVVPSVVLPAAEVVTVVPVKAMTVVSSVVLPVEEAMAVVPSIVLPVEEVMTAVPPSASSPLVVPPVAEVWRLLRPTVPVLGAPVQTRRPPATGCRDTAA
jgi:hypothetical protein